MPYDLSARLSYSVDIYNHRHLCNYWHQRLTMGDWVVEACTLPWYATIQCESALSHYRTFKLSTHALLRVVNVLYMHSTSPLFTDYTWWSWISWYIVDYRENFWPDSRTSTLHPNGAGASGLLSPVLSHFCCDCGSTSPTHPTRQNIRMDTRCSASLQRFEVVVPFSQNLGAPSCCCRYKHALHRHLSL